MKIGLCASLVMVFAMSFAVAQSAFDGAWTAEIVQKGKVVANATITLVTDGSTVTGSVDGIRTGATTAPRAELEIEEGIVDGDTIRFKTRYPARNYEVVQVYTGKLKGDQIAFTRVTEDESGAPDEFIAKRAN